MPLGILAAVAPVVLALSNGLLFALGNNATLSMILSGALVVYWSTRPSLAEGGFTLALAAALDAVGVHYFGWTAQPFGFECLVWAGLLGFASIVSLGLRVVGARAEARTMAARDFWAAAVFLHSWIILVFALHATPVNLPRTFDRSLCAFDGSLGFQPSFLLGRLIARHPFVTRLTLLQYQALMLAFAFVLARQRSRAPANMVRVLAVFATMMVSGYLLYHLLPAAGPAYAFQPLFPYTIPDSLQLALGPLVLPEAARNAMPSLHMGTALLIWWHSRGCSWVGRLLAGSFLLATVFSTLATGEHYLIDLVVAFPFVAAVQSAWATSVPLGRRERWLPVLCGAGMTFGWLALLRFGIPFMLISSLIPWTLIVFTVTCSLAWEMRLARKLQICAGRDW